jgi:PAS domain S-box-containing protein
MVEGHAQIEPSLHEFLRIHRDEIVVRWERYARTLSPGRTLSSRALVDHLPSIVDSLAVTVESKGIERADLVAEESSSHTQQRLGRGYSLEDVITEYNVLREAIFDIWEERTGAGVPVPDLWVLERGIETCLLNSASRFTRERERTLRALDRISEAALAGGDQTQFFEQLLQAVVEAVDVVDTAAILLRRGDLLQIQSSVGIQEDPLSFSINIGEGFAGKIASEARPFFVENAAQSPLVKNDALRRADVHALYGVPLIAGGEVIGVAKMGSRAASEFSEDDKLLFETMASRVTQLIQSASWEAQVEQTDARNQAILDAALDCVISMDTSGLVLDWNPAAERTFGYSRSEALGADMADLIIPPVYRKAHREGVRRYLTTGEQRYFNRRLEFLALKKDGAEFPVELTITEAQGRERMFIGFVRDLTEAKQAEQERQRLVDQLSQAGEAQRFLAEASKSLSGSLDYGATLANVAQLAVPTLGDWCAVDVLQDQRLRRVSVAHVDPAKCALVQDLANRYPSEPDAPLGPARVVRTGKSEVARDITDSMLIGAARDSRHLSILRGLGLESYVSAPICIRGSVFGAITVVSSESGRRYSESDIPLLEEFALRVATAIENAHLYSETRAAVRTREDVLAMVSHDLRNPLNNIALSAEALSYALLAAGEKDNTLIKQTEMIRRAAGRMDHLIGDLLDMASIQANGLSVERRPVEFSAVLDEALEAHAREAKEKGVVLRHKLRDEDLVLLCDRNRLMQVLSNLLGNAIKFCSSGSTVTVHAGRVGDEALISVEDTGLGIAASDLENIFDPYWTVGRKREEGTGLGLYITKAIVEAHGGKIWVKSEPGSGAAFFFTIPVDRSN